jgi:hypothetical protein
LSSIAEDIVKFWDDPYKFVIYAFPWGEPGTPLEHYIGPDKWQRELLQHITTEIRKGNESAIQFAVTSGHGVGKSSMTSWIILWYISTRPNPQILITANTMQQLSTKTWRELSKWHQLAINRDWFEWTATRFYHKEKPETWFAAALPWSEHRSEAFAGMHEENVLVIFDEASGIADKIWEVVEGAMTTSGAMWFAFGNPTQNIGRFRECFRKFKHRWINYKVDSRDAAMASQSQIRKWSEDYGEDSDFFLVRVKGEFPSRSDTQFIPSSLVDDAVERVAQVSGDYPVLIGVDVARNEGDKSVILVRKGPKILTIQKFNGLSGSQLTHKISDIKASFPSSTVFIDEVGVGASVVDHCKMLGIKFIPVNAASKPDSPMFVNKRSEMWHQMREWLKKADIPNDPDLIGGLIGIQYSYKRETEQLLMESKKDMRSRMGSPDEADALALTFAYNVLPESLKLRPQQIQHGVDSWNTWET